MNEDMHAMFQSLNRKVDGIASGIENKLSKKFSHLFDTRMNSKIAKVKKDIDTRIQTQKEDYADISTFESKISDVSSDMSDGLSGEEKDNRDMRIVVRNVPDRKNENVIDTMVF